MTTFAVPTPTAAAWPRRAEPDEPTSRPAVGPAGTEQLLRARDRLPAGHGDRELLRMRAIEQSLPLARRLARRYVGRGEDLDDLEQVASLALIRAVDGWDPARSVPFASFAVPSILGALKRHFRDAVWAVRIPRRTQEILQEIPFAIETLTQRLQRQPTSVELAAHLRVAAHELSTALGAATAYRLTSLDAPAVRGSATALGDLIGATDPHYVDLENHLALGPLVAALPPREKRILALRFDEEMSQGGIAAELGISQMHVSRLLRGCIARLRVGMLGGTENDRHAEVMSNAPGDHGAGAVQRKCPDGWRL